MLVEQNLRQGFAPCAGKSPPFLVCIKYLSIAKNPTSGFPLPLSKSHVPWSRDCRDLSHLMHRTIGSTSLTCPQPLPRKTCPRGSAGEHYTGAMQGHLGSNADTLEFGQPHPQQPQIQPALIFPYLSSRSLPASTGLSLRAAERRWPCARRGGKPHPPSWGTCARRRNAQEYCTPSRPVWNLGYPRSFLCIYFSQILASSYICTILSLIAAPASRTPRIA